MRRKHNLEDILDKGEDLIRCQGYTNTGIETILKACGIPKGSFYNFFKNKEDFAIKVMRNYSARYCEPLRQVISDTSLSPMARLEKYYAIIIATNEEEKFRHGCLLANITQELGGLNETISAEAKAHFERTVGILEVCLQEGQEKGEIRTDFPARELANLLHNSLIGALLRMKATRSSEPLRQFCEMMLAFIKSQ